MKLIITPRPGRAPAFRHLWLRRVSGMDDTHGEHCIGCLKAVRDPRVTTHGRGETALDLEPLEMLPPGPGSPVYYLCGVSRLWRTNLHVVLVAGAGEVEVFAYDGTRVRATGARAVTIPEVPELWEGRTSKQTQCRNWRFAQGWFRPSEFPALLGPAGT